MQIDFNAFRKRGVSAFNDLCAELNGRISSEGRINLGPAGDSLCVGDIQHEMDALRQCMAILISLEDKADGIECLNIDIAVFAPEE